MIKVTQKLCNGPCEQKKVIWKNYKGKKYCLKCWNLLKPDILLTLVKKTKSTSKKKISARSEKRIIADKKYLKLRKQFLIDHPTCACNGSIPGCTGSDPQYLTIQHKRGRVGSLYLDIRYWCTLALSCHQYINEHPDIALELGLAEHRLINNNENDDQSTELFKKQG